MSWSDFGTSPVSKRSCEGFLPFREQLEPFRPATDIWVGVLFSAGLGRLLPSDPEREQANLSHPMTTHFSSQELTGEREARALHWLGHITRRRVCGDVMRLCVDQMCALRTGVLSNCRLCVR